MASSRKVIPDNKSGNDSSDAGSDESVLAAVRAALSSLSRIDGPAEGSRAIAIALSGGLDSTVLLDASVRVASAARCVALHVHHGLSPNADAWLEHARTVAREAGVAFEACRVRIAADDDAGIEAAARDARYDALFDLCNAFCSHVLLLGHHADDQAETFLLQALRGAGLRGVASMPAVAETVRGRVAGATVSDPRMKRATRHQAAFANPSRETGANRAQVPPAAYEQGMQVVQVARPLLALPRSVLLDYARRRGLRWIDDESNDDLRYARNALRHAVIPPLAEHFPAYREGLARSARHAAEAQTLLDEYAALDMQLLKVHIGETRLHSTGLSTSTSTSTLPSPSTSISPASPSSLSLSAWRDLDASSPLRAANVLRYWVRACGMRAMSAARFDNFVDKLRTAASDRSLSFSHERHTLRHYRGVLEWEARSEAQCGTSDAHAQGEPHLHWTGEPVWYLPAWRGTIVFVPTDAADPQRVSGARLGSSELRARPRSGGERMRTGAAGPSRTLKNLFQEAGLPEWRRDVPVILLGEDVLYVPGLGLNHDTAVTGLQAGAHGSEAQRDASQPMQWLRLEWRPDLLIA